MTKTRAVLVGVIVAGVAGCSSTTTVIERVAVSAVAHTVSPRATHMAKPKPKSTPKATPVATVRATPTAPATAAAAALPPLLVIGSYSGTEPTTLGVGSDNLVKDVV